MAATDNVSARSRTARIRDLARTDDAAAVAELTAFLHEVFGIDVAALRINRDQYSLNSLNGVFDSDGAGFFFKFHQEEGEENMKGEYYRAEIIAEAGLPIDMPVLMSTQPGEQILVYARRDDRRFSDVLLALDTAPDAAAETQAAAAESALNARILDVALRTLHPVTAAQVAVEPIHHLFHHRMVDPATGATPGGRLRDFYVGKTFDLPGATLDWPQFSTARLRINGRDMRASFGEIFAAAARDLHPDNLTAAGGITAHGDAHNANIWFETGPNGPTLAYFDPAFAGRHIPSLIAEAKATFHNVFAHPLWLYHANDASATFHAHASHVDGTLSIETDWAPSRVRQRLLDAKIDAFWKPFLAHLAAQDMLPATWRQTLRSALAMCPALVMNLRAGADRHTSVSSAIAFAVVAQCGSAPVTGTDMVADFLSRIDPVQATVP